MLYVLMYLKNYSSLPGANENTAQFCAVQNRDLVRDSEAGLVVSTLPFGQTT